MEEARNGAFDVVVDCGPAWRGEPGSAGRVRLEVGARALLAAHFSGSTIVRSGPLDADLWKSEEIGELESKTRAARRTVRDCPWRRRRVCFLTTDCTTEGCAKQRSACRCPSGTPHRGKDREESWYVPSRELVSSFARQLREDR